MFAEADPVSAEEGVNCLTAHDDNGDDDDDDANNPQNSEPDQSINGGESSSRGSGGGSGGNVHPGSCTGDGKTYRTAAAPKHHSRRPMGSQKRHKSWIKKLMSGEISQAMFKKYHREEEVAKEVRELMGKANSLYIQGPSRFAEAAEILRRVIALKPDAGALPVLASIYGAQAGLRHQRKATDLYMLQAHLTPSKTSLWRTLANRYHQQGQFSEACYCLHHAASSVKRNPDEAARFLKEKADLHLTAGHKKGKVVTTLCMIIKMQLTDQALLEDSLLLLAEIYHKHGESAKALKVLADGIASTSSSPDYYPTRAAAMICEIQMEQGHFAEAMSFIESAAASPFRCAFTDLPVDLLSKYIICQLYRDDRSLEAYFLKLRGSLNGPVWTQLQLYLDPECIESSEAGSAREAMVERTGKTVPVKTICHRRRSVTWLILTGWMMRRRVGRRFALTLRKAMPTRILVRESLLLDMGMDPYESFGTSVTCEKYSRMGRQWYGCVKCFPRARR
eukprot:NODE_314_length_2470_cov_39.108220_g291_i0.p1 GENE.NODE_314_length_2470_cov_39.108220_g291_i0~~NODE_314_length_2470_cov_39.108220_g291_i0.p1  ORF type:complete len:506 (+),score=80.65 NODE_314_length_2470_cov_39.108220_g291_i0:82-1599(+)